MTKRYFQTQSNISAVLFDYGGVIAEEGFKNGLIALAKEQELDVEAMPKEATKAVYDTGFVLGHGSAKDFWQRMRERTGLAGDDTALTNRILAGFVLHPWVIELVQNLHNNGYITGILSDQTHWLDELNERDHFYQHFDPVFNSYYLGKGKQDSSLFNEVATELKLPISEILFIDDDAGNVKRAEEAGMQTIHYVDKETFIHQLKQQTGIPV